MVFCFSRILFNLLNCRDLNCRSRLYLIARPRRRCRDCMAAFTQPGPPYTFATGLFNFRHRCQSRNGPEISLHKLGFIRPFNGLLFNGRRGYGIMFPSLSLTLFRPCSMLTDMRRDVQEIFRATPHHKQVMMFSATLSKDIRTTCKKFMQSVCTD